jgi:hypothetical protein
MGGGRLTVPVMRPTVPTSVPPVSIIPFDRLDPATLHRNAGTPTAGDVAA